MDFWSGVSDTVIQEIKERRKLCRLACVNTMWGRRGVSIDESV
jgi:hypothetical protein